MSSTEVGLNSSSGDRNISDQNLSGSNNHNKTFQISVKSKNLNSVRSDVIPLESSDLETTKEDVFLCFVFKNGKLGAAFLSFADNELYVVEDTVDLGPEYSVTRNLYSRIKPALTITIGQRDSTFVKAIIQSASGSSADSTTSLETSKSVPSNVKLLKPSEYSFEASLHAVKQLSLPGEPPNATDEDRYIYLNTLINFERKSLCHALGTLLLFLNKYWSMLQDDSDGPKYLNLNTCNIVSMMAMDQDTFSALQIFNSVGHPADFKKGQNQGNKEHLSIFKLFNKCRSSLGKWNLRTLLLQPTNDPDVLRKRQDFIEFCLKPVNNGIIKAISDSLKKIYNLRFVFLKIHGNTATLNEWKKLQSTLHNILLINQVCMPHMAKVELFQDLSNAISEEFYVLLQNIMRTIDFENSYNDRIAIKYGIDEELDKKNRYKEEIKDKISLAASYEMSNLPPYVNDCLILHVPEIGYVLSVKWSEDMDFQELNDTFGLKHYFTLDGNVHFKSPVCEELDKALGDVFSDTYAIEVKVLMALTLEVMANCASLQRPLRIVCLFDSLLCFAEVAKELNYVRPIMTYENVIHIEEGRHPLLELVLDNYVPNNYISGGNEPCLKILTGPNASGKSIYAKQAAVIVYLAHIGSFIPAKSATIGYMKGIYTRIRTVDSHINDISSFILNLREMSYASMCADKNSLVLIDEFGKGTSELDGLALLTAFLKSFLRREEFCPHTIVSTHYLELTNLLPASSMVEHLKPDYKNFQGKVIFLYKVVKGVASSYAFQAALCGGLSSKIINRAKEVLKEYLEENNKAIESASTQS